MTRITWTQRQDIGPSARSNAALAFDLGRSRTVLFGGSGANGSQFDSLGDTWEWDGEHWTQVQDSGPAARSMAAMAHGHAGVVLFGGHLQNAISGSQRARDTWSWDGTDWTQLADTGPSARVASSLVYDGERYVLFGGAGEKTDLGDTWTFDGSEWTQFADTGPSPRESHAMAYDAARSKVILFGGQSGAQINSDTWSWDGTEWSQWADTGPSPRVGHVMAGDATSVWLFGGESSYQIDAAVFGDSWEWDGSLWTQRQDIGPSPRADAGMAFDAQRDRIVLFGGDGSGAEPNTSVLIGDTWEARTEPAPDAFTIITPDAMVAGSDLGYVMVSDIPVSATARPVSVVVDGLVDPTVSPPLAAGENTGLAFFRLGARPPGPFKIRVTVGTSTAEADVTVVAGSPLRDFGFANPVIAQGGNAILDATVPLSDVAQKITLMSMTREQLGEYEVPPQSQGLVQPTIQTDPTIGKGAHAIIAILAETGGLSIAGPVMLTIN